MKFDENSRLVKMWVERVKEGTYTREQVPKLFNLRDVVWGVLDKEEAND